MIIDRVNKMSLNYEGTKIVCAGVKNGIIVVNRIDTEFQDITFYELGGIVVS